MKHGAGKNRSHVSTSIGVDTFDVINRRAAGLGWTRGKYLREILHKWHEQGAKPVSAFDAAVNGHSKKEASHG